MADFDFEPSRKFVHRSSLQRVPDISKSSPSAPEGLENGERAQAQDLTNLAPGFREKRG